MFEELLALSFWPIFSLMGSHHLMDNTCKTGLEDISALVLETSNSLVGINWFKG